MNDASINGFRARLIHAIHSGKLYDFCKAALDNEPALSGDDRALAQSGLAACTEISSQTQAFQNRLMTRFRDVGLNAEPWPLVHPQSGLQFHHCDIYLDTSELKLALEILAQEGFFVDDVLLRKWRIVQRCSHTLEFMIWDEVSMRLTLHWGKNGKNALRKLLPNPKDLAFIDIPDRFWPLYMVVKPLRALSEKLLKRIWPRKTRQNSQTQSAAVNLGTPHILLAPLFEAINLTKRDRLVDLGCGDGRVMIAAAQKYGCKTMGVEQNGALAKAAQKAADEAGVSDLVTVHHGSINDIALDDSDVVFLFLPHRVLSKTINDIKAHLPEGARIVAHEQTRLITDWAPTYRTPIITSNAITIASVWITNTQSSDESAHSGSI